MRTTKFIYYLFTYLKKCTKMFKWMIKWRKKNNERNQRTIHKAMSDHWSVKKKYNKKCEKLSKNYGRNKI